MPACVLDFCLSFCSARFLLTMLLVPLSYRKFVVDEFSPTEFEESDGFNRRGKVRFAGDLGIERMKVIKIVG